MHWKQTTAYRWANNVFHLYYDGFKRLFFFPNFLKEKAPKGNEAAYVSSQITGRAE